MTTEFDWASALVGQWVLHTPTGLVDKVERFFTGKDGDAPSPAQNFPCLRLSRGDVLVADENAFIPITEDECQFYVLAEGVFAHAIKETLTLGKASGKIEFRSACVLLEAALSAQLRTISTDNTKQDKLMPVFR